METSWTLIKGAAEGEDGARADFVARYAPFVRRVLHSHWAGKAIAMEIDDTVQNIWVECFKDNGVIDRADPDRSFRAFLCGVIRREEQKVAQKWAREWPRRAPGTNAEEEVPDPHVAFSRILDREWAFQVMDEAWKVFEGRAGQEGEAALHRVEVLRLRNRESLPPRRIAERRGLGT